MLKPGQKETRKRTFFNKTDEKKISLIRSIVNRCRLKIVKCMPKGLMKVAQNKGTISVYTL